MRTLTAGKLCTVIGGKLINGNPEVKVKGIMSKCDSVIPGLSYFDVKGGKGGDRNILEAIKNGAVAIVISKHKKVLPFEDKEFPVISVPKLWEAFWKAVTYYRNLCDIPVVGVTGTSGKTTTKEMLSSIFSRRWRVLKTLGNLNLPDFVPSHIMRLRYGYQAAVFEIGMNRPGQIAKQARIIQPKVGVITHIGTGHIEHLGSYENVILEKSGIIQGIPDDGFLVLNVDDPATGKIDISGFKGRIIYYGLKNQADFMAEKIEYKDEGTFFTALINGIPNRFFIPTFGQHNVYNALAAIAVARVYDFDIKTIRLGLGSYRKPHMRLQIVKGIRNCKLINDTYNANPDSMMAGLEVLATLAKGRTSVAVLGNMLEQGTFAIENHRRVGEKAADLKVDWLITVGTLAKEIAKGATAKSKDMKIWSFRLKSQAIPFLRKSLPEESVILIKGSRGSYMERLVKELKELKELPLTQFVNGKG